MIYIIDVMPSCQRAIDKACKKNPVLKKVLRHKMGEITIFPSHYKPLKYDLAGERRVHILKSFILKFKVDDSRKVVTFLAFEHHDNAYKK